MKTDLRLFVPDYKGTSTVNGIEHVWLQNLLFGGQRPYVMDLKIGTRTFKDSECTSAKLRPDLLEKMIEIDPNEPTEEERLHGITKLRYMSFRERMSSSATLGFRFDGVKSFSAGGAPDPDASSFVLSKRDTVKIRTREEVAECLRKFLGGRRDVQRAMLLRLRNLRAALEGNEWFETHELIGSSLLFVYDRSAAGPPAAGVWMIDFANSNPQPRVARGAAREDGYLFGLDNLIALWDTV